jgi:cobalt transporter subunit CbtB
LRAHLCFSSRYDPVPVLLDAPRLMRRSVQLAMCFSEDVMSNRAFAVTGPIDSPSTPALWRDRVRPALFAGALAIVLLYPVAFSPMEALHNAAHDGRHSAGFPCH